MESDTHATGGSIFVSLLQVLFIGLKLGGVIEWSWWWVMSPLWISWGLVLLISVPVLLYFGRKWRKL